MGNKRWYAAAGLAAGALVAFTTALPVFAQPPVAGAEQPAGRPGGHGPRQAHHRRHRPAARITALTASQVTVTWPGKAHRTATLARSGLAVYAGLYPAAGSVLAVGEHIRLEGGPAHPQALVVLPEAGGTLENSNGVWSLQGRERTWTLALPAQPVLLGMSALTAGSRAQVFGTASGSSLAVSAVAAPPAWIRGAVVSDQGGTLVVKTVQGNRAVDISTALDARRAGHLKPGRRVRVALAPGTSRALAVLPAGRRHGWRARPGTATVGTLESTGDGSFQVRNLLGTQVVNTSGRTVTVRWHGHQGATLSGIPAGTRVAVLARHGGHDLLVVVLPARPRG
ncbi:MAG: hypothetical protein OWV35_08030 [Firmicutes bacterium]|nr:hypothetical protein [Bacillota bacterium]